MTNQQLKAHCEDVIANPQDHLDWVVDMARVSLASLEAVPVAWVTMQKEFCDDERTAITNQIDADRYSLNYYDLTALYAAPPVTEMKLPDEDYFSRLVAAARERAEKAMRKFPQPNYVLNKVAEESGEVIKAVIHYTEGREDWLSVEGELIDNLAMLIRLIKEGDQVIGFNPPDEVKRLNAPHTAPIEPICATGGAERVKPVPRELKQVLLELRTYNPKADEYGGKHIIQGWADRIEKTLGIKPAAPEEE